MGLVNSLQQMWINRQLERLRQDMEKELVGGVLDKVLLLAMNAMSLLFIVNKDYRKNIEDFKGRYVIASDDRAIDVSAVFKKKRVLFNTLDVMEVTDAVIDDPTVTVTFRDGKAMAKFLLSGKPDVIAGMLDNQLSVTGNVNYLFKFVYMIMHIPELLGIRDFQNMITRALAKS